MGGDRAQRRVLWATLVGVFVTSFPSVILVAALPDIRAAVMGTEDMQEGIRSFIERRPAVFKGK